MKNIIILFFLSLSVSVLSQDTEMLGYINQYRSVHGKSNLMISKTLTNLAENQLSIIVLQNKLSHTKMDTGVVSEICNMGTSLPTTLDVESKFINFLKVNFNIVYVEPKNDVEVVKYVKLYIIYLFDSSPSHKVILLGIHKFVGFSYSIDKIKYAPNYIELMGEKHYWKNIISHYNVDFYSVVVFN